MDEVPLGPDEDPVEEVMRKEKEICPPEGSSLGQCLRKKLARPFNH